MQNYKDNTEYGVSNTLNSGINYLFQETISDD